MKKKPSFLEKKGQSYVGVGKLIIWVLVIFIVFMLRLCGFDVQYPTFIP